MAIKPTSKTPTNLNYGKPRLTNKKMSKINLPGKKGGKRKGN